jgi:hypothetical protein
LTKTGDDYEVKTAHVELAERMRKVGCDNQMHWLLCFSPFYLYVNMRLIWQEKNSIIQYMIIGSYVSKKPKGLIDKTISQTL